MTPSELDGTPAEFPHREEAMSNYRAMWGAYIMTKNPELQQELETGMDAEQLRICRGPGPIWQEFTKTLPGFHQFWASLGQEMVGKIRSLFPSE